MANLQAGAVVSRFKVVQLIRQGGSGLIYDAIDEQDGSRIALKIPDSSYLGDIPSWERFRREVVLARKLKHPLIADIKEASDDPSHPFLAVEFVEGIDLQEHIRTHGPMPIEDAIRISIQLCETLDYIHSQQVIHRDLKPANIMLQSDGTPKLVDFGIAKPLDMKRITWKGFSKTFGTPSYMAPEQVQGARITTATDIYALGVILYELLTGRPPFEGDNAFQVMNWQVTKAPQPPHTLRPEIPEWLEAVTLRALEKRPQHRYQQASEMKKDLETCSAPFPLPDAPVRSSIPPFIWVVVGISGGIIILIFLLAITHHHG